MSPRNGPPETAGARAVSAEDPLANKARIRLELGLATDDKVTWMNSMTVAFRLGKIASRSG